MANHPTWTVSKTLKDGTTVDCTFQWVDNGIGAFECHGFKGTQTSWNAELIGTSKEVSEDDAILLEQEETETRKKLIEEEMEKSYQSLKNEWE